MTLAAVYIGSLITNYGSAVVGSGSFLSFTSSSLSVWMKFGTVLATQLLYIWTLVAPRLFPDREF